MNKKESIILALLLGLILILGVAAAIVAAGRQPQVIINEFVPPAFDQAAIIGQPPELPANLGYGILAMQEDASVGLCRNVMVTDGNAMLYLTAPGTNRCWVRVLIYAEDGTLLGESGLLRPGEYITSVALCTTPKTGSLVSVRIQLYEPDTYLSLGSANAQVYIMGS